MTPPQSLSQRLRRSFLLRLFVVACALILLGGLSAHGLIFLSRSPAQPLKEQIFSLCTEQLAPDLADPSARAAAENEPSSAAARKARALFQSKATGSRFMHFCIARVRRRVVPRRRGAT